MTKYLSKAKKKKLRVKIYQIYIFDKKLHTFSYAALSQKESNDNENQGRRIVIKSKPFLRDPSNKLGRVIKRLVYVLTCVFIFL